MASKRDEQLSKKEQEEEEIRNQIRSAGFPDVEGWDMEYMQLMKKALDESLSCSQNAKISETLKSSNNLKAERSTNLSGDLSIQLVPSENQLNDKENSPESDSSTSYRQHLNNQTATSSNKDVDILLPIPDDPHFQRKPLFSIEKLDPEMYKKLYDEMSLKMDKLREQFILSLSTEKSSMWGSPIKVATKQDNSMDKNSPTENIQFSNSCDADISTRDACNQLSKRKALTTNENSDNEFVNSKKRKFQQEKLEDVKKKNQEKKEIKGSLNPNEKDEFDDSDSDIFENIDLFSLPESLNTKTSKQANEKEIKNIDTSIESEYPRRIIPPNTCKKNFKGPRAKTKNIQLQNNIIKNESFLNEDDINKCLDELNKQIHDNDSASRDEIKYLRSDKRIEMSKAYLLKQRNEDEQKNKAKQEAIKQKEIEEKVKKEELIKKRLQIREEEKAQKQEKEKKKKEKEIIFSKFLNSRTRMTTRSSIHLSNVTTEIYEDLLETDDDEITLSRPNSCETICPICQTYYPSDEIAAHASECQEYSSESHEINNHQPSTSHSRLPETLECNICNNYSTIDGYKYEKHVIECKDTVEIRRKGMYCAN